MEMLFSAPEAFLLKQQHMKSGRLLNLGASHTLSIALEKRRGLNGQIFLNLHSSGNTERTQPGINVFLRKFSFNTIYINWVSGNFHEWKPNAQIYSTSVAFQLGAT